MSSRASVTIILEKKMINTNFRKSILFKTDFRKIFSILQSANFAILPESIHILECMLLE